MENELLKRLIAIIARFDQGITEAEGGEGYRQTSNQRSQTNPELLMIILHLFMI